MKMTQKYILKKVIFMRLAEMHFESIVFSGFQVHAVGK